jgi:hypothetical protein
MYSIGHLVAFLFVRPNLTGTQLIFYDYILLVADSDLTQSPKMLVTAERTGAQMRKMSNVVKETPFLCVFYEGARNNLGSDERYSVDHYFLASAERLIRERFGISSSLQPLERKELGSSRGSVGAITSMKDGQRKVNIKGTEISVTSPKVVGFAVALVIAMLVYPPVRTYRGYSYKFITDIGHGEELNLILLLLQWFVVGLSATAALWWLRRDK